MKIVLASASPRRKELLGTIFPCFEILAPDVDETPLPSEAPIAHAERLSFLKAHTVFTPKKHRKNNQLIIASDTIVALGNDIFGKPKNYSDARLMLSQLSGKTHLVHTAITLIYCTNEKCEILTETETTHVIFKKLSEFDIEHYLSMIEWRDKAGSYAAQHGGEMIIERIDGSFTNVIGFPLRRFFSMTVTLGLERILFTSACTGEALLQ